MIFSFFLFLLGLTFGSFIAAFTYRYPRNISIVGGRSFCPKCKSPISWFDNIPVLSFVLLRAKCRKCKKGISFRYPIIEIVTGVGFLLIKLNLAYLLLFLILEAVFVIDLENQIIPDNLISLFALPISTNNILAAFLSADFLLLIHLATRGKGMGLGDVKFALLAGLILGLHLIFIWLFLSFLIGSLVGVILLLARRLRFKDKIAFGPFLVISLVTVFIWGERIIKYLKF